MPKFKGSFKITAVIEKTYIITNYEVDLADDECEGADGIVDDQTIKDTIVDRIQEDINTGDFKLEDSGELVDTNYDNDYPEFITGPTKVE